MEKFQSHGRLFHGGDIFSSRGLVGKNRQDWTQSLAITANQLLHRGDIMIKERIDSFCFFFFRNKKITDHLFNPDLVNG